MTSNDDTALTPRQIHPERSLLRFAAILSGGAGLIHAAAVGTHGGNSTLVALFTIATVVQVGWAAAVMVSADRRLVLAGVAANLGCAVVWALTRFTGIGFVGSLSEVEAVGVADTLAAVTAAASALVAIGALWLVNTSVTTTSPPRRIPAGAAVLAAVALTVPGLVASGDHDADGHSHGSESADVHGHDETDGHSHDEPTGLAADPIFAGADTSGLTDAQLTAAKDLIERTQKAMERFPDVASVEAAGYRSIQDSITGFEHFVNHQYRNDGKDLDPDAIESIVAKVEPDGTKTIASAMYILSNGTTMADAPDIAGDLTMWHDHQNLCWDDKGQVRGILRDGVCFPGGTFRPTAPMLHVWVVPHECGPFAGIEGAGPLAAVVGGHGSGCDHSHGASDESSGSGDGESASSD